MGKKLDVFQLLEREGYLWSGSVVGLCVGFVLFATMMLVMGTEVIRYPRLLPASMLVMVGLTLVGRYAGHLRWRKRTT